MGVQDEQTAAGTNLLVSKYLAVLSNKVAVFAAAAAVVAVAVVDGTGAGAVVDGTGAVDDTGVPVALVLELSELVIKILGGVV